MSFYGDIKRVQSSPFVFDKIYPNREAMDAEVASDGVYIGRYVLVKYTTDGEGQYFTEYQGSTANTQSVYQGYKNNATADINKYGDTFDGTVWQKIYTATNSTATPTEKYILVAELNAAVPRLELKVVSPKSFNGTTETWNIPTINPTASSEDAYLFNLPDMLHLEVGSIDSNNYASQMLSPVTRTHIKEGNNYLTREQMYSTENNFIGWTNQTATRNSAGKITSITSTTTTSKTVDQKTLNIRLYGFGQAVSDVYDVLYGIPGGDGYGTRPFYVDDLTDVVPKNGLVGILSSIGTELKGAPQNDWAGREMKAGMYYYFTSKWADSTESPDSFIENIPQVIGSIDEKNAGKSHLAIENWAIV